MENIYKKSVIPVEPKITTYIYFQICQLRSKSSKKSQVVRLLHFDPISKNRINKYDIEFKKQNLNLRNMVILTLTPLNFVKAKKKQIIKNNVLLY